MDVSIPALDGWEAAKILQAESATSHIPIIMHGFLAKPVRP